MKRILSILFLMALPAMLISCWGDQDDPNEDLRRDMKAIDAYINTLGVSPEKVLYDNQSGVRFVFQEFGQDIPVSPTQKIDYDVIARVLAGGSLGVPFINNAESKKIEEVTPEGLNYGLRSVLAGSIFSVYAPARHAYGSAGNATLGVPGDAIVRFDVNLKKVERTVAQQSKFEQDTTTIKNYLANEQIDAIQHPSGFWYTIDEQGGGKQPTPYSSVTFEYELRSVAAPETIIESNTLTGNFVWGLINGLKIGFQLMSEGSTYTFYFPSGMCYGPNPPTGIPQNSNLIFKVKLTDVGS
jgi:FKBP-type peptidyl-prolyl cis-trans isomerase FkpA